MAYKYLVYKLYKLASSLEYDHTPKFTALISVSALMFFNLASINNAADHFDIKLPFFQSRLGYVLSAVIILIINIILVNKIGIDNMGTQFSKENEKRNDICVLIYTLGSFALYLISLSFIKVQQ